jgi:general secretion pathway protein A
MYNDFFGFNERPFKLVPNPAYLFQSKSHEEVLAHLIYSVNQGDGFVEITGEVGTGKTTLCRVFLENIGKNVESAYIFNPKLDAIQLLKNINDEFGIDSKANNTKTLIDTLNAFLMEKMAGGVKAVLLIDEAQNLTREVLEQLRLLSNLEITNRKLLEIILVGQPELREILASRELRQLKQRISLRCRLTPLTYQESIEYIQHRIGIASGKLKADFTPASYRAIHKYSKGIPRLINIACDRILLAAYVLRQQKITGNIARKGIKDLSGEGDGRLHRFAMMRKVLLACAVLGFLLVPSALYRYINPDISTVLKTTKGEKDSPVLKTAKNEKDKATLKTTKDEKDRTDPSEKRKANPRLDQAPAQKPAETRALKSGAVESAANPVQDLDVFLKGLNLRDLRYAAFKDAVNLWDINVMTRSYLAAADDDHTFFQLAARQNGFMLLRVKCKLNLLKKLNLPAILKFNVRENPRSAYLALSKIDDGAVILRDGQEGGLISVRPEQLATRWSGTAYILWKNFLGFRGIIPLSSPGDSIIALKMHLQDIGLGEFGIDPVYDEKTRAAVKRIQTKHDLKPDGLAGPLTQIVLYNEKKSFKIPHIASETRTDSH